MYHTVIAPQAYAYLSTQSRSGQVMHGMASVFVLVSSPNLSPSVHGTFAPLPPTCSLL